MRPKVYSVRKKVEGQAMVEYLVAGAVIVGLLFGKIGGQDSIATVMMKSIRTGYSNFYTAVSVPN